MFEYRKKREAYVKLYKRTQHAFWLKPLDKKESAELRAMEVRIACVCDRQMLICTIGTIGL